MLYKLTPQCFFCNHINPAGATFCNDCGSPLHLKPCKHCEAINDQAAKNCYKCGKDDPALVSPDEAPPMLLPGSAAQNGDVLSRPQDNATAQDCEPCVEVVALEPRALDRDASSPLSGNSDAASLASSQDRGAASGRHPMARAAMAGLPPAVLLVALALSAFYAYLHPLQLREWLSAKLPPADQNRGVAPTQSITGKDGVLAASPPAAGLETGRVSVATPTASTPPNESANNTAGPLVRQDGTPAIGTHDVAGQTVSPIQSSVEAPGAAAATTAQPRETIMRTAGDEVPQKDAATSRSVATHATTAPRGENSRPRDSRAALSSQVTSPGGCSGAAAALGTCSAKKTATSAKTSAKKPKKTSTKKAGSSQATPAPTASPTTTEVQGNAERPQ